MNAYLHPGDKIHIAVGINSTASVADATGQVQNHLKTLIPRDTTGTTAPPRVRWDDQRRSTVPEGYSFLE